MRHPRRTLVPVLLLTIGLVLGAACGGGSTDEPSEASGTPAANTTPVSNATASPEVEEYFQSLQDVTDDYQTSASELTPIGGIATYSSDDAAHTAIQTFLVEGHTVVEDFVAALSALDAPPETAEAHANAVSAGEGAVARFEDLMSAADNASTHDEIDAVFTGLLGSNEAFDAFALSCTALQELADQFGVEVDLQCG